MADISFLLLQDDKGYYRLEDDGTRRVDMTEDEANAMLDAQAGNHLAEALQENYQRHLAEAGGTATRVDISTHERLALWREHVEPLIQRRTRKFGVADLQRALFPTTPSRWKRISHEYDLILAVCKAIEKETKAQTDQDEQEGKTARRFLHQLPSSQKFCWIGEIRREKG